MLASANSPYSETIAAIPGKTASSAKNATPPEVDRIRFSEIDQNTRQRISLHPRGGIAPACLRRAHGPIHWHARDRPGWRTRSWLRRQRASHLLCRQPSRRGRAHSPRARPSGFPRQGTNRSWRSLFRRRHAAIATPTKYGSVLRTEGKGAIYVLALPDNHARMDERSNAVRRRLFQIEPLRVGEFSNACVRGILPLRQLWPGQSRSSIDRASGPF